MTSGAEIRLEVASTLDDQVRLYELLLRKPDALRRQRRQLAAGVFLYPMIAMVLAFVGGTLAAGQAPTRGFGERTGCCGVRSCAHASGRC